MGLRSKTTDGSARARAELSRAESEASLDSEHERAMSYEFWSAWLRHVEALVRCERADGQRGSRGVERP